MPADLLGVTQQPGAIPAPGQRAPWPDSRTRSGKEQTMYASVRRYTGVDPRAMEEIERLRGEIEAAMRRAPGFQAWYLVRTSDGILTVTLCADQAGAEETVQAAAGIIREKLAALIPNPPEVTNGEVALQIGG
jgi:hypothetical protein